MRYSRGSSETESRVSIRERMKKKTRVARINTRLKYHGNRSRETIVNFSLEMKFLTRATYATIYRKIADIIVH